MRCSSKRIARILSVCACISAVAVAGARAETSDSEPRRDGDGPRLDRKSITLILTGDLGLNASMERVRSDAGVKHSTAHPWATLTAGIAADLKADLVFGNLETVVTDRNDLVADPKAFNFRTHPQGVRHLIERGFNLFSTANNHAADFRTLGIIETLDHLDAMLPYGLKAHAGIGRNRQEAAGPKRMETAGGSVLLSAIGIGGGGAGDNRPGQLAWHSRSDFVEALTKLSATPGNYRMLSVHYNTELSVTPAAADITKLRDEAVRGAGIDLVIGHHAHVPAGIQAVGEKLIFYGLGNFLHLGTQDMSSFGICRDFGVLARLHLASDAKGRLVASAVEIIPVTGMHASTRRMAPEQSRARIHVLNYLASGLDAPQADARGVRFTPQPDGRGIYCATGADGEGEPTAALCKGWSEPAAPLEGLRNQIASSCGHAVIAARARERKAATRTAAKPQAANSSMVASVFGY